MILHWVIFVRVTTTAQAVSTPADLPCPWQSCTCSTDLNNSHSMPGQTVFCSAIPRHNLTSDIVLLKVSSDLLTVYADMFAVAEKVLSLDLSGCNIKEITSGAFTEIYTLRVLRLSNNKISNISIGDFGRLQHLLQLHLDSNMLQAIETEALCQLTRLRYLHLQNNLLIQVPSKLPSSLLYLDLSDNLIGRQLQHSSYEVSLEWLDLCGNFLQEMPDTHLFNMSRLHSLCVGDYAIKLPPNYARGLPYLTNLTLQAARSPVTNLSSATQAEIKNFRALTDLTIADYAVETLQFVPLHHLRHLTLRNVHLSANKSHFIGVSGSPLLLSLDLSGSPQIAARLLDHLEQFHQLKYLSLHNTNVTTIATDSESAFRSLTRLDLSSNPLNCDCRSLALILQHDMRTPFLVSRSETLCHTPVNVTGLRMTEAIRDLCGLTSPAPPTPVKINSVTLLSHYLLGVLLAMLCLVVIVLLGFYIYIRNKKIELFDSSQSFELQRDEESIESEKS